MYEKSQVTASNILDAAQLSFVNYNYDDITMSDIAREANMTKGAIYHHFKSKEDLYLQMMGRYLEQLENLLHEAVEAAGSARERLALLTTIYLRQPLEEQLVIQLVRRDANRFSSETRQRLIATYQKALPNQIEAIIAEGMAANEIMCGDARLYAWQFVAIVEVYLSQYARQQFDAPEAMVRHLSSLFFDGVAQSPVDSKKGSSNGTNVH